MAKRLMNYFGHVIYWDENGYFTFAKGDGTDYIFDGLRGALVKIEEIEGIDSSKEWNEAFDYSGTSN